ncbi:MAG: FG-GAP repeat protein, partial [Myxococcota bacterium]
AGDPGTKLLGAVPVGHAGAVAAGDLDGDGYADAVVGAPADPDGGTAAGAVSVVLGGTRVGSGATRSLVDAEGRLHGHLPGLRFGESVAVVGGRHGEGAALAVGAPGADDGGTDAGALMLWDGATLLGAADTADAAPATLLGVSPGDAAGSAVTAGDLDGDGWLDLLVGAPGRDDAGSGAGAAYVGWGAGL